ncbi:PEP-CTERM putative exosortase interaction domain-containing protein [Opitutaceae bacterium TAV1]|nr:PEP-CTERM putative exosortase interaction domain-containing protein [Opitutaceae bacterium TAV1]
MTAHRHNPIAISGILLALALASLAAHGQTTTTTIFEDTFSRTGALLGSSPDTTSGSVTWTGWGGERLGTDGSQLVINNGGGSWGHLVYDLSSAPAGAILTFSTTITHDSASTGTLGIGISPDTDYTHAQPLIRITATGTIDVRKTGSVSAGALVATTSHSLTAPVTASIRIDTGSGEVSFVIDEQPVGSFTYTATELGNFRNFFVAGLANGSKGYVDNVSLKMQVPGVPEPATFALIAGACCAGTFLLRRIRKS